MNLKIESNNALTGLMKFSKVVVDSANLNEINLYNPIDATTNPSSVLQAIEKGGIESILNQAQVRKIIQRLDRNNNKKNIKKQRVELIYDGLLIELAARILAKIPGYVSVEVDAEFAYNQKETLKRARGLIEIAKQKKIDSRRILLKIASTWQGIKTAQILEKEGICCNLTLIFNFYQALACAQINAFTISPFVGRVLDWYKRNNKSQDYSNANDEPGVLLVRQIQQYFKKYQLNTIVMGASFRNIREIEALSGCDKLTIAPKFLKQLSEVISLDKNLTAQIDKKVNLPSEIQLIDEQFFNEKIESDPMAKELLANGIARFAKDTLKLKQIIAQIYLD